jgi:hypothetical protein
VTARWLALAALAIAVPAQAQFEANGVKLGDAERLVLERFPSAHCQPLQWRSRAADRRCDDSRARIDGIETRITVYLKGGAVQALDLRFRTAEAPRFAKLLTEQLGAAPTEKRGEKTRTLQWKKAGEQALLTTEPGERRATLLVWRGDFNDEIYKVR